jgi:thymidylate synthase ThyX
MITSRILAHSWAEESHLVSFELKYPRFIHSELLTHRGASKNSASSRAIPFEVMVTSIEDCIALPEYWGTEQKGMQSGPRLEDPEEILYCESVWREAFVDAVKHARRLRETPKGNIIHKSLANRLLEPFAHMTVVFTIEGKMLNHFFALRAHPDAQPEFQVLAFRMLSKFVHSKPMELSHGEWHMPFGDRMPADADQGTRLQIATARCARVSYNNHDGTKLPVSKDMELHDRLLESTPFHASPFEHCAQYNWQRGASWNGNFGYPWVQYRKTLPRETVYQLNLQERLAAKPEWVKILEEV